MKDNLEFYNNIVANYSLHGAKYFINNYGYSRREIEKLVLKLKLKYDPNLKYLVAKEEIISDYKDGKPLEILASKYGLNRHKIKSYLLQWKVQLRSNRKPEKRFANHEFFSRIDGHEKAYWLGFIYADGNVGMCCNSPYLQIGLSIKDKNHLQAFRTVLQSNHKIHESDTVASIQINSKKIFADLGNLGVFPRKSLNLTFPTEKQVPKEFLRSFILGYFDGDGSISECCKNNKWTFNLIGTTPFLQEVSKLQKEFGISETKLSLATGVVSEKISYLTKHGIIFYDSKNKQLKRRIPNLEKLYEFLYSENPNYCLERKKTVFENILEKRHGENWRKIIKI